MKKTGFLIATLLLAPLLSAHADGVGSAKTYDTLVLMQACTEFNDCIGAGITGNPADTFIVSEFFTPCNFSSASSCVLPPNCPNSNKLKCNDHGAEFFTTEFIDQSDGSFTNFYLGTMPVSSLPAGLVVPGPLVCYPTGQCTTSWEVTIARNGYVDWTVAPDGIFVYTPEPNSFWLLLAGLAATITIWYRRPFNVNS
jgi:hypothetical protein